MTLTIKYFGMLIEVTQCTEETVPFTEGTISDLLKQLFKKHPLLEEKAFKVAQNQSLVNEDEIVSHSEIALLPPFSGG